ncbi:MAG: hypothetical protein RLZZ77_1225, partial [Bacteroidota bacterium]
ITPTEAPAKVGGGDANKTEAPAKVGGGDARQNKKGSEHWVQNLFL